MWKFPCEVGNKVSCWWGEDRVTAGVGDRKRGKFGKANVGN